MSARVVGDVAAGSWFDGTLRPGEAVRVMTGAPMPAGADVVVPVERTRSGAFAPDGSVPATVDVPVPSPDDRPHVRRAGEDVAAGTTVGRVGDVVTGRLAALAAAVGHGTLPVRRAPLVAVLSTGDELVPPGERLRPGSIPDSNSVLLAGAAREAGALAWRRGGVTDTAEALAAALDDAVAAGADLIVTTGGVSVGAHDVVRALLDALGTSPSDRASTGPSGPAGGGAVTGAVAGAVTDAVTDAEVATVGMAPGKPQGLARWRGVPWVAAPGNPTGAYASFELFVRPMLRRMSGLPDAPSQTVVAAAPGWSSPHGRVQLVPVRVRPDGTVERAGDGHRLSSLAESDGLAVVDAEVRAVGPGDQVPVRWFAGANPGVRPARAESSHRVGAAVFDAIVLAGGHAKRLGTPKPSLDLGGSTLLDHALRATRGARGVVVVGPGELAEQVGDRAVVTREDPAFGGPVAGIAAGLAALGRSAASRIVVLACDVPRAAGAIPALLAAVTDPDARDRKDASDRTDGAYLVRDGHAQWLVGVYERDALEDALKDLASTRHDGLTGASVRSLVEHLRCLEVPDPDGLSDDVDTPADAARLAAALTPQNRPQPRGDRDARA